MRERYSWLKSFISQYRRSVVVAIVLGLVASGCTALLMFTSGFLISQTAQADVTLFSIMIPVAFVQLFGLGRPVARYLERLISHNWVFRVTSDLRLKLYRFIAAHATDPAAEKQSGEYLSLLADDIGHLQNLYLRVVFPSLITMLLIVGATIVFGIFTPAFALIMLIVFLGTAIGLPFVTLLLTRARSERNKQAKAEVYSSLTDDILGSRDWVLAGRGAEVISAHRQTGKDLRSQQSSTRVIDRTMELVTTLLLGLALCLTIAWAAGRFGGDPSTANWIAAFALGFFPLIEAFAAMPGVMSSSVEHEGAVDNLRDIIDSPVELPEIPADRATAGAESVDIEDVSYSYPGQARLAIDSLSLKIPAGQHVAILGRSGSGKSTLAGIMRGFLQPTAGSVSLSGTVLNASSYDYSNRIGLLTQDPYVFNKTLRDNLLLGQAKRTDAELISLLESVGLGSRYEQLSDGLNTVIGETGTGFSGGESHRIALARVLAADTGLIIVDEPFAALDPLTEQELLDTLLDSCANRTLVVITHHLAAIERFDRVVFVEDGRVDLDGSPQELLETSEYFRMLLSFDRGTEVA